MFVQSRFVQPVAEVVDMPHLFAHNEKRSILAFCSNEEQEAQAVSVYACGGAS
jgi:hypothetical protein